MYGAIFGVCFITVMSTMVWSINISGNNRITDEEILTVLAESGIKPGTLRKNVDAASARFHAIHSLSELSYMSVNMLGSSIEVIVAETADKAQKNDSDLPCDVVSKVDGQVAAIEVYQGTKLHGEGEAIRAGEALAGGFVELNDGSVKFKHAEAYALIRTDLSFETSTHRKSDTLTLTDERVRTTIHFMCFNIPLYIDDGTSPTFTRHSQMVINNTVIPIGITQRIYRKYSEALTEYDNDRLMLSAAETHLTEKMKKLDGAYICSEEININNTGTSVIIKDEVLGEISAGIAKEMLTE